MKKIIPIFLLIIICVNHLNIIDTIVHFSSRYYKDKAAKSVPIDEENEHQKDCKAKEKGEEEKYYQKSNYNNSNIFNLSNKDKFTCFSTRLHKYPYHEDEIRPPQYI